MNELAVFERTREFMRQGARGIVYGRNIIQHPKTKQMTRALMAIVHRDVSPEEAAALLEQG
jgi:DhnA family fructose-bisphosphate aldolase class Ia